MKTVVNTSQILSVLIILASAESLFAKVIMNTYTTNQVFSGGIFERPSFSITKSYFIESIRTYHWHNGMADSKISLINTTTSQVFGPYATIYEKQNNRLAKPNSTLPPGTYLVDDSKSESWSWDSGVPFVRIDGSAIASSTATKRYHVELLKKTVDPSTIQSSFVADFDEDGKSDLVEFDNYMIKIRFATGFEKVWKVDNQKYRIHDIEIVSLNADERFPSIVLTTARWERNFYHSNDQYILLNNHGKFVFKPISVSLVGRNVSCTKTIAKAGATCFFASYGENDLMLGISKMVFIDGNGNGTDVTRSFNLPFPVKFTGFGSDGYHMLGTAFLDFNLDGLEDLIVVGQHSGILTAIQNQENHFLPQGYHGKKGEFLYVSVPLKSKDDKVARPPCAYFNMEEAESDIPDFMECFDDQTDEWYNVTLPEGPYFMHYTQVQFLKSDTDGKLEFAVHKKDGEWNLLRLTQ